ncbi:hypothetical protein TrVE_jg2508 [Triparma verrucosa]|uniref:Uncharacterized protein n=1 Tax=Triparma verrucosa TaxID=1606542 RepID=A0A9W7C3I2_9STRA|nr:hypothetical protein TrVE_jg2508 [Triparma verrucosa]
MQDTIAKLKDYTSLCEARIKELHPDHPLPIQHIHIGAPLPETAPPNNSLPLMSKNVPAFVLSAAASNNRQEREDRTMIMELRRQKEHEEARNQELTKQNLQLRSFADRKTREAQVLNRHLVNSQTKVKEMESQLVGLQTSDSRKRINAMSSKPPVSTNIKAHSKVKELTMEVEALKKELETSQFKVTEGDLQIKVLEDALEFKAQEWGIVSHGNGGRLLADFAKLKGEVVSLKKANKDGDLSNKESQLDLKAYKTELEAMEVKMKKKDDEFADLRDNFNKLGGDVLTELEKEKDALLDYVTESLDNVTTLESEKNDLQEEVLTLSGFKNECEELKAEVANFNVKHKNMATELEELREKNTKITEMNEEQKTEIEELAKMQIELLHQLKESTSEFEGKSRMCTELQADLVDRESHVVNTKQSLETTTLSLNQALASLAESEEKIALVVPKLDSADAELRLLRSRLRELETVEGENSKMLGELSLLRPVKEALDRVSADLRAAVNVSGDGTKTSWHQAWINGGNLAVLLPSLGDRIQAMLTDLSTCESQQSTLTSLLNTERAERDMERKVLSDSLVAREQESGDLSRQVKTMNDEHGELRAQSDRAKEAEAAIAQLRTVWVTHCHEDGVGDGSVSTDLELVYSIGRALFAGRQGTQRASATLQKLVESEALCNMKELEMTRLDAELKNVIRELTDLRANSDADLAGLKSESTALNSELESAAELAERQGALALTLEGRLEALSAERALLSSQFHASQNELEQYRAELNSMLSFAIGSAKDVISSSPEFAMISEVTNMSPVSKVVEAVCLVLSVLSSKVPELCDEVIEAQAKLEMAQITKLARTPVQHAVSTPSVKDQPHTPVLFSNKSRNEDSSVSKHKESIASMQKKYLSSHLARSAVENAMNPRSFSHKKESMSRHEDQQKRIQNIRSMSAAAEIETPSHAKPNIRAPSPATKLLQDRLRKAQAAFADLAAKA